MSSSTASAEQTQAGQPLPLPARLAAIPASTHLHYLEHALTLAQLSPPKPTNYRVGAAIVSFPSSSHVQHDDTAAGSSSSLEHSSGIAQKNETSRHRGGSGSEDIQGTILATGYTLELPGNTHAEQCCLLKLASLHNIPESRVGEVLKPHQPTNTNPSQDTPVIILYTTMEPCTYRLSGNDPCVERILNTKDRDGNQAIDSVVVGVAEPDTFVKRNEGRARLEERGVRVLKVGGREMEERILGVAREGHGREGEEGGGDGV